MQDPDLAVSRHPATLRVLVEEKLRAAIAAGRFTPGQRLIERELCDLLGVGRTSVREALRQLEAEGLVTTVPHRGPVVSTISVAEAEQLYALRGLLEGFAGRTFAERRPKEPLRRLKTAVKALEQAAAGSDRGALIAAKTEFYDALLEGCGNAFVQQALKTLHNRVTLLRATSMTQPGRLAESLAEIRGIADAIAAGDAARAERSCISHIRSAAKVALEVLADSEVSSISNP
ncbi:MAG TPA: GntR family transcriptional regulator [Hyphomicrobiaceae bacterium]|nr:GntR family transcriptional regulator [Hyphomicrobiaceae bacterium]